MAGFDKQILTDKGWDALADALAHKKLTFVHLSAGDGTVTGDAQMQTMVQLSHWIMDFPITSYTDDGQGQVTLIGTLASANVTTGFYFRELGVNATIDDGTELLFSCSNTGDQADFIPDKNSPGQVIQSVEVKVKIDRATNVVINVQPSLDVTAQNIGAGTIGPGWFRDKIGQILNFKRLKTSGALVTTETSDLITINCPLPPPIPTDLDLYVPVDSVKPTTSFPSIQAAWDSLANFSIPSNRQVRIHVAEGIFNLTSQINLNHTNGSQISIIGAPVVKLPIVSINPNWISQGKYNWQADVTVQDASKVQIDDIVGWYGSGSTAWDGAHRVVSKSGNTIRILLPCYRASGFPISNINGTVHVNPTLLWYPTRNRCTFAGINVYVSYYGLGKFSNMSFLSTKSAAQPTQRSWYTLIVLGAARVEDCAFCRGDYGHLYAGGSAGQLTLSRVYVGDSMAGIISAAVVSCERGDGSTALGANPGSGSVMVGCCYRGLWGAGGRFFGLFARASACEGEGILADTGGSVGLNIDPVGRSAGMNYCSYNNSGLVGGNGGQSRVDAIDSTSNTTDLFAFNTGMVLVSNAWGVVSQYTTISPPKNVQGNTYAIVMAP